jgi:hypothetical protein
MKFVQSLFGDTGLTRSDSFCFWSIVDKSELFGFSYEKGARIHSNSWGNMQCCVFGVHMQV